MHHAHTRHLHQTSDVFETGRLPGFSEVGMGVRLLGSSGEGMAATQQALSALLDVHSTVDVMLRDYSMPLLLGTWSISQVILP